MVYNLINMKFTFEEGVEITTEEQQFTMLNEAIKWEKKGYCEMLVVGIGCIDNEEVIEAYVMNQDDLDEGMGGIYLKMFLPKP